MLEDTDKIAISMSGGLDSSLMTWLLCKEISDKNKNTKVINLKIPKLNLSFQKPPPKLY